MKPNTYALTRQALQDLCAEAAKPGEILFRISFTAAQVAQKAGVSESTARKWLNGLARCRDYSSRRFPGGTIGYRYDGCN